MIPSTGFAWDAVPALHPWLFTVKPFGLLLETRARAFSFPLIIEARTVSKARLLLDHTISACYAILGGTSSRRLDLRHFLQAHLGDGHLAHSILLNFAGDRHRVFGNKFDEPGDFVVGDLAFTKLS